MATIETIYLGDLRTEATHVQSGTKIITDAPVDNQGKGEADLVYRFRFHTKVRDPKTVELGAPALRAVLMIAYGARDFVSEACRPRCRPR